MAEPTLSGYVVRLGEALAIVEGLPPAIVGDCRPALSLALAETTDLAALARWLEAHGPTAIAGITPTAEGCVLRHLSLSVDSGRWPCLLPLDGPTPFASDRCDILKSYWAARSAATAPVVLLDTVTVGSPTRLQPADAPAVLHALHRAAPFSVKST